MKNKFACNVKLLEEYVSASGLKKSYLANVLGISRTSLGLKLNGEREFRASEAFILGMLLGISNSDLREIFLPKR